MNVMKNYPVWVCEQCGFNASGILPKMAAWQTGDKCGVCGRSVAVTEPRDFGYPSFDGGKVNA